MRFILVRGLDDLSDRVRGSSAREFRPAHVILQRITRYSNNMSCHTASGGAWLAGAGTVNSDIVLSVSLGPQLRIAMLVFLSPLHKATRQIGVYFERRMEGMPISPQEGHILSYLRSYAPCPIAELVRVFGLKQSTMTSLLDRLEHEQYIVREVNPHDRRSFIVKITRQGRALAGKIQKLVDEIERELKRRVTAGQLKGFQAVMAAVDEFTHVDLRGGRQP